MPSYQATDYLALKTRADTLALSPAMTIYEPGAIVDPPSDAIGPLPYILASDVPNDPERVGLSSL